MPFWFWIVIILGSVLILGLLIFFFVKWQQAASRAQSAENNLYACNQIVGTATAAALRQAKSL